MGCHCLLGHNNILTHKYFLSSIFSLFHGLFPSINILYLKKKKKIRVCIVLIAFLATFSALRFFTIKITTCTICNTSEAIWRTCELCVSVNSYTISHFPSIPFFPVSFASSFSSSLHKQSFAHFMATQSLRAVFKEHQSDRLTSFHQRHWNCSQCLKTWVLGVGFGGTQVLMSIVPCLS